MRKFRIGIIIGAVVICIAELTFIDFSNFTLSKNLGPCLTLSAMILVIFSQIFELRNEKNM
jgi:hypothetical protein